MTSRERALLALTMVGFLVPNAMVIVFVIEHGLDFNDYFSHWGESLPALVGLCFGLPLFLLLRERAVRERPLSPAVRRQEKPLESMEVHT